MRYKAFWGTCLGVVLFAFCTHAGPIYLKADAGGGGSGSNWENACTSFEAAIAAAQNTDDHVIYAAQGVYQYANTMAFPSDIFIYGGFAGESMDETPEGRDTEAHQTIITGDKGLDDVWTHVVPSDTPCTAPAQTVTELKVIDNGRVTLPTAFSGKYDTYFNATKGSTTSATVFKTNKHNFLLDGLWFVGLYTSSGSAGGIETADDAGLTQADIVNCRFIGCKCHGGCIKPAVASVQNMIKDCLFFGVSAQSDSRQGICIYFSGDKAIVDGCSFVSCSSPGASYGGNLLYLSAEKSGNRVQNSTIARNFVCSNSTTMEGSKSRISLILALGTHATFPFRNCVITNNMMVSTTTVGYQLLQSAQGVELQASYVAGNRMETLAAGGRIYALMGTNRESTTGNVSAFLSDGTTICSNTVCAVAADGETGTAYLAMIGNWAGYSGYFNIINTTFLDNAIEARDTDDLAFVRSRGVAINATANTVQLGVANCLFAGEETEGVKDVVLAGAAQQTTAIIDSIFTTKGRVARPFLFSDPSRVTVKYCTIKNGETLDEAIKADGNTTDDIPLSGLTSVNGRAAPIMRPLARLEGIRTACDITTNSANYNICAAYRLPGSQSWTSLIPKMTTAVTAKNPTLDAEGVVRPFGSGTRGPVQTMSALAEDPSAHLLLVRTDPIDGGAVSVPNTQMVAADGTSTAVMAIPDEGVAPGGWYCGDEKIAEGAILPAMALAADKTVVARFVMAAEVVTFDLGDAGTFVENGEPTITLELNPGADLAVPAFSCKENYIVVGWTPAVPEKVPVGGGTYVARSVTKDVRTVTVKPGDDIQAAIDDMGIYRGEVHFTMGTYPLSAPLVPRANVALIGDEAGVELSGGGTLQFALNQRDADHNVTNQFIAGIAFRDFKDGVLNFAADSSVTVSNCTFTGNTAAWTGGGVAYYAATFAGPVEIVDCNFHDNGRLMLFNCADNAVTNRIVGCTFTNNASDRYGTCFRDESQHLIVSNCTFRRNSGSARAYVGAAAFNLTLPATGTFLCTDSVFEENIVTDSCYGVVVFDGVDGSKAEFERCAFRNNRCDSGVVNDNGSAHSAVFYASTGTLRVRDCLFDGNTAKGGLDYTSGAANAGWASVFFGYGNFCSDTFYNCTFRNNSAEVSAKGESDTAHCGTFVILGGGYSSLALLNCTVEGSSFACTAADSYGEFNCIANTATANLYNSIFHSAAPGYTNVGLRMTVNYARCAVTGMEGMDADPRLNNKLSSCEGYPDQLAVRGDSPFRKCGYTPYRSGSALLIYAPDLKKNTPWIRMPDALAYTDEEALEQYGLSTASEPAPDAFGRPRTVGKVACGPLNAIPNGLLLILR